MKNFDDHRAKRLNKDQRTFQIGGEQFVAKASVRPEAITEWEGIDPETTKPGEIIQITDRTILALMEPGETIRHDDEGKPVGEAHERFGALRLREGDDAINLGDLMELIKWLIEVQSGGRPTGQQSDSGQSPSATGASSTAASPLPVSPAEPQPSTSDNS